jgi:hypothetical protein
VSDLEFGEGEVDGVVVDLAAAQQQPSDTSPTGHSRAVAGVVGHDPDVRSASAKEPSRCRSGSPLRLPVAKLPVA